MLLNKSQFLITEKTNNQHRRLKAGPNVTKERGNIGPAASGQLKQKIPY